MMLFGIIKAGWQSSECHCSMELRQEQLISDCTCFYLCSIITVRSQVFRDSMPAYYKTKDIIYMMKEIFQHFSGMDN